MLAPQPCLSLRGYFGLISNAELNISVCYRPCLWFFGAHTISVLSAVTSCDKC